MKLNLEPLERGKCYILTGTMTNWSLGQSILLAIGNETSKSHLGAVAANGDFTFSFDYTTSDTFYKSIYIYENPITGNPVTFDLENLAVKLDPNCATEYCSECFDKDECGVSNSQEYLYLEWTNNDDGFGMNYTKVPLVHSLWIKGALRNADYPYEEDYFTTSSGTHFPVYVDSVKTIEMWVHDLPEYMHDALRLGVVHDSFTVNGVEYTKGDGGYSPDWDTPNSLLAPVIVKLREKYQDTKNENC